MLDYLKVIAGSFPIAVMFIAFCVAVVVIYIVRSIRRAEADDKAYRAAQARAVSRRSEDG
jgi:uncharacterized membrane protein